MIFIVSGLLVGRFLLACLYIHPHADDLSYTVAALQDPSLGRILREYHTWNGRWVSNFLVLRNPMMPGWDAGLFLYRLVPACMIMATGGALMWLLKALVPAAGPVVIGTAALTVLLTYLHVMPDLYEGIYWYTGAITYHLASLGMVLLAAGWLHYEQRPHVLPMLLNILLTILIAGSSEVHMVLLLMAHAAWVLIALRSGRHRRPAMLMLMVVLVSAVIMIAAPGNAIRGHYFPERHQILHSIWSGSLQTIRFMATWIFHPVMLTASILFILFDRRYGLSERFTIHPLAAAFLLVSVIFLLMVLPYWATGTLGQHRTVNVACFVFIFGWSFTLGRLDHHMGRRPWPVPLNARVVFGAWVIACMAFGNGLRLNQDLWNGSFAAFDRAAFVRYRHITYALETGTLDRIPPVPALHSLRIFDPGPDPEHWANRSLVEYLRLRPLPDE
jgi:hypothetical protein